MKTAAIMLTVALATSVLVSNAQDKTQGKINYEHSINLHASLKPDQQQFKDMIPEFSTSQQSLYFNGKHTKVEHEDIEDQETDEGPTVKIKVVGAGNISYSDGTPEGTYILVEKEGKQTLMKQKTMTEETLKKIKEDNLETDVAFGNKNENLKEKIGKKTKNILGFECTGVSYGEMTLWVTPLLPFRSGPMGVLSEHGAILGMEDGNKMKIYATSVEYTPVKIEDVTPPSDLEIK